MILFPYDDKGAIPCAYYETTDHEGDDGSPPQSGDFDDYATFIKREMPTLVRRELENLFEGEFQDVDEKLRPRVAEIVVGLQTKLLDLYKQSQSPLSDYGPQHGAGNSSDPSLTPALSQRTGTNSTPATDEGHANAGGEVNFDVNGLIDFDANNLGLGLWDANTDAAHLSETAHDANQFSWDNEFDRLINPTLFMPQNTDTATYHY